MLDRKLLKIMIINILSLLVFNIAQAKVENISVELRDGTHISGVKTIERKQPNRELTVFGFIVGASKLSDVKEKFKSNKIYHEGDAAASIYVLCYEGGDGSILIFESSGEMGGSDHVITSASVYDSHESYHLKKECIKSSLVKKGMDIGGIRLGMSNSEVKKLKGNPSSEQQKILLYEYRVEEKTAKGQVDISSSTEIRFADNKVSNISISKIESY